MYMLFFVVERKLIGNVTPPIGFYVMKYVVYSCTLHFYIKMDDELPNSIWLNFAYLDSFSFPF